MKILFTENIPWLQRVVEYKLVDSRWMIQSDEYKWLEILKEEITNEREFFRTLLNSFSLSQALSDEESRGSIYRQ